MSLAIQVENLSKSYRIGQFNTGALSQDFERWWARIRGKEDPFELINEPNNLTEATDSKISWSLRDINLSIGKGETLGIIGKNGAGKSTLLKILSRVTSPTTGIVKMKGRVSSLLEVGTGFHPELTGRENIFLNGSILGMGRAEIQAKLNQIIEFSGIGKYIDTPVKRYSSGMYVRLAFSVAAHLESEIMIVDEVLAVGDADFQTRCIEKMKDLITNEGRTVLFVSHNLSSVKKLCNSSILLEQGCIKMVGKTDLVIDEYLSFQRGQSLLRRDFDSDPPSNSFLQIDGVKILSDKMQDIEEVNTDTTFIIAINYTVNKINQGFGFTLVMSDKDENIVLSSIGNTDESYKQPLGIGKYITTVKIPGKMLNNELFFVSLIAYDHSFQQTITIEKALKIEVNDAPSLRSDFLGVYEGVLRPKFYWQTTAN